MKAIRIKFFQGTASFKEPLWNGTLLPTRPLPPYSTVIGMIHTLCQWEELHRIKLSLNYPPVYPSLGRWEDSIRIDDVKIVEVKEELTHGKLNCYTWLPVKDNSVERIGSVWKIPTYYKIVRDKRRFEYIKCYLGERGALALYRLDEDNEQLILI